MLPIRDQEKVSIFGRSQIEYYRSGTGSGGAVNVSYKTNILQGLGEKKKIIINETLAKTYEDWMKAFLNMEFPLLVQQMVLLEFVWRVDYTKAVKDRVRTRYL